MNIVHIAPNAPFNEGWGFQENLLTKHQAKLGHKVTLIVSSQTHKDGKIVAVKPESFTSVGGFDVIRLPYVKYKINALSTVFWKMDVYSLLCELKPDFIFYHGLVSRTIFDVIRYKKQQMKKGIKCTLVQDNHLDYNIGCDPKTLKEKILRQYYRIMNNRSQKNVDRIYGVTPWRKQYAEEYYRISPDKTDVLIMGADDEKIDFARKADIRASIRAKYGISDDDFLVVTGGKIDVKKKIHLLMKACVNLDKVRLLVFGSISDDIKAEYNSILSSSDNIISIGWLDADKVYDYFFAADLVFFPGQHSVLWEQACAAKAPCVFARWPGMDHVDNGGNSDFINDVTVDSIADKITELRFTRKYYNMKAVAESEATDIYLYSKIAQKSLS